MGLIASFIAPAFSSALIEADNAPKKVSVQTIDNAADTWWESYAEQTGFVEALTHIEYNLAALRKDPAQAIKDSADSRTSLYWLKRTMKMYSPSNPNQYYMPIPRAEENGHADSRYSTKRRGKMFFTRTFGNAGQTVQINAATIPEGTTCWAGTSSKFDNAYEVYGDQTQLQSNRQISYTFKNTGMLVLGCGDLDRQKDDQFVELNVSGGSPSNLYILGQSTQNDWEKARKNINSLGYTFMFDGRANTVVPRSTSEKTTEIIGSTLGYNLGIMSLYEKLNGMDGSDRLYKSSQGSFFLNYQECCYANYINGYVAIGFNSGSMNATDRTQDWGLWHELGHLFEPMLEYSMLAPEIQVNRYSIEACRVQHGNTDVALKKCHGNILGNTSWDPNALKDFLLSDESYSYYAEAEAGSGWNRLRFFNYLRFAYGHEIFAKVNQVRMKAIDAAPGSSVHQQNFAVLGTEELVNDLLVEAYSKASGHDLREYFTRWGIHASSAAKDKVGRLNLPQPNDIVDKEKPQAIVGSDLNVIATTSNGFAYKLDGSKSLNAASHTWSKLSGPFHLRNPDQAIAEAVVPKNSTGESVYQLTVTNKNGLQATSTVTVRATDAKVTISGPTSIIQGQATSLKAQANFGNAPTYRWKVRNAQGSEVLQEIQQTLHLSALAVGKYDVTVEVSSPHGGRHASLQQNIVVEKKGAIRPPVAIVTGPAQVAANASVVLNAANSSASNGGNLVYHWTVTPYLPTSVSGSTLRFTAPKLTQDTQYQFTLSVDEGALSSAPKNHSVMVKKAVVEEVGGCKEIPQWQKKSYTGGLNVQYQGRSYTSKWWAEPSHIPGVAGWVGAVWNDNGTCN